jgi:energy-converting hydrogenase Eha subunit A
MRLFKITLLLFGSFAIAYSLSNFLHELGHAIAIWTTGGIVDRITLSPFSWSYTWYDSEPKLPVYTASAGIVLGTLSALLLVTLTWRFRRQPWSLIFLLTGIVETASNGLYAVFDSLLSSGGDATDLIQYGVPASLIIGVGILLLIGSLLLSVAAFWPIGFGPKNVLLKRILVLEGGILPYLLCIVVYQLNYNRQDNTLYILSAGCGVALILAIAGLSHLLQSRFQHPPVDDSYDPSWAYTLFVVALGILVIVLELALF